MDGAANITCQTTPETAKYFWLPTLLNPPIGTNIVEFKTRQDAIYFIEKNFDRWMNEERPKYVLALL